MSSRIHNLGDNRIGLDLNPAMLRLELNTKNNGRRMQHQNGNSPCDHDWNDRSRFGHVWYVIKSWLEEKYSMLQGKFVWLLSEIKRLQAEEGIELSSRFPSMFSNVNDLNIF